MSAAGYVYFAEGGQSGLVKVGWSRNPEQRMGTLEASEGNAKVSLLGFVPGFISDEKRLQAMLHRWRVRGEWFEKGPILSKIMAFVLTSNEVPSYKALLAELPPYPEPEIHFGMSVEQVRKYLTEVCDQLGGMRQWALFHGMTSAYVSDVVHGRQEPGPAILDALKLERIVTYRPKRGQK